MTKTNKLAGFWIKVLSRLIDLLVISGIATTLLFFMVVKKSDTYLFKEWWMFYLWYSLLILIISFFSFVLPIITKGYTLGGFILRLKIISLDNKLTKGIIKKELFFSLSWIFLIVLIMVVINHTFVLEFMNKLSNKESFEGWDAFRVAIISTTSSFIIITQLVCIVTVIVKKDNRGIHEKYGNVKIILVNKYIDIKKEDKKIKVKLKVIENKPVEWIGE